MTKKYKNDGFTVVEVLMVLGILAVLGSIIISTLYNFRLNQALAKDTETLVESLNQARNQTISSKDLSVYGVHFAPTSVTVFTGSTYDPSAVTNQVFNLNPQDTVLSVNLATGGYDVIFERLSGETVNNGTVTVSSSGLPNIKTVTIYRTGIVESE